MDIYYLKLFNTLASELSFSRAANMLYISQPALSMQIKKLEKDLGCRLFDKIGKQIYLNANGKILFEYTNKIFALMDEAENRLSSINNVIAGTVSIGASNTPGSYMLPQILGEFMGMYPEVNANLHVGNTFQIERMILDNKVDFAVNGGDISYGKQIHVEKLVDDHVVFITSPSSPLADREDVEGEDLARCRVITHERDSQLYILVGNIFKELGLPINITMTLGSVDAIKQAVSANLGISAIPRSAIGMAIRFGTLKYFKLKDREWLYPYNLIYHKNRFLSAAAQKLMQLVGERMKNI